MRRGFPFLLRVAPKMPRWTLRLCARWTMRAVMVVYRHPQRAIERNLRRIFGPAVSAAEIRRARRQVIYHLGYYWADLFRLCQLPYEETKKELARVEGFEHLEEAVASGKGAVLLTAHLGNWELGGVFLREKKLPVSVVYVPDQSPTAEAFRGQLRRGSEIHEIAIDPKAELSSLPVLRALKEGRIVALQGDRDFNDRGEWVDFLGTPAPFPLGPFQLARITGAVLLPSFIVYDPEYRFEIHIGSPIRVDQGERGEAIRRGLAEWVAVLEKAVRRWPTQWYTFYDFWGQEPRPAAERPEPARQEAV
ncbi:MAG: lysophospholipid acyltransferase family protein [Thermoanaerobaculia bacterium]